jgi:hypothetical protein
MLLVPGVNAGQAGWCVVRLSTHKSGCGSARSDSPVVAEAWSSGGPPVVTVGYAVTLSDVSSLLFDGDQSVKTSTNPALPPGIRAASVEFRGENFLGEIGHDPRFIPVGADGEVLPSSGRPVPYAESVPVRAVRDPMRPRSGVCEIDARAVGGLSAEGGSVITSVARYSGLIGEGFVSCASTLFNLAGWPVLATVLISASNPGAAPRALPEMTPVPGRRGLFEAPGPGTRGSESMLLMRRVRGGWLLVSGAKPKQRLIVMKALSATVRTSDAS